MKDPKTGFLKDSELLHDRDERQIEEPANAVEEDDLPKLDIRSTKPMRCFVNRCAVPISNNEPWIIFQSAGGGIFAHMRCLGMNVSGNFNDPAYLRHLRDRLQTGLKGN